MEVSVKQAPCLHEGPWGAACQGAKNGQKTWGPRIPEHVKAEGVGNGLVRQWLGHNCLRQNNGGKGGDGEEKGVIKGLLPMFHYFIDFGRNHF